MNMHQAVEQLKAVLCNPEGEVCIKGSDADRKIIQDALAALTGDTQQEAIATKLETDEFGCFHTDYEGFKRLKALPVGAKIFTHPPEAAALAQEVKDKAVEICRKWETTSRWIDVQAIEEIASIPIPEPRPDALVAMAYRKAAEVCQGLVGSDGGGGISIKRDFAFVDAKQAILALTPPAAQFALEELCDRIIREAVKAVEQAAGNNWEYCGEVAKLTNAIFELRTTLNRDKSGVGRFIPDSECKQGKCMNATTGCQDACKFPPEYSATLNQHSYANGVDTPNGKD